MHIRKQQYLFCVVTVWEAYEHAVGSVSEIVQIAKGFPFFLSTYWRRENNIGHNMFLNGLAAQVLILWSTTEAQRLDPNKLMMQQMRRGLS